MISRLQPLRVALDTNVVVSALVFNSPALSWLYPAIQNLDLIPMVSAETGSELDRTLQYPQFRLDTLRRKAVMGAYLPWCVIIDIAEPPETPECRDPKDRCFLELALCGHADALSTGDSDRLALAPVFSIPIVTPAALRMWLESSRRKDE